MAGVEKATEVTVIRIDQLLKRFQNCKMSSAGTESDAEIARLLNEQYKFVNHFRIHFSSFAVRIFSDELSSLKVRLLQNDESCQSVEPNNFDIDNRQLTSSSINVKYSYLNYCINDIFDFDRQIQILNKLKTMVILLNFFKSRKFFMQIRLTKRQSSKSNNKQMIFVLYFKTKKVIIFIF